MIRVGRHRMAEPCGGLVLPTGRQQHLRVRVVQPCRLLAHRRRIGSGVLEGHQGGIELAHVHPRTGFDDAQFHEVLTGDLAGLLPPGELDGLLRALETPLAVGHHREQTGTSRDPSGRTQFPEGLGPLTGPVGEHSEGLPDDAYPPGAILRGPPVGEGQLGIVVHEMHRRDQVPSHQLGVRLVQPTEVPPDLHVEICGLDLVGEGRFVDPRCLAGVLTGATGGSPVVELPSATARLTAGRPTAAVGAGVTTTLPRTRGVGPLTPGPIRAPAPATGRRVTGSGTPLTGLSGAGPVVALAPAFTEGTVVPPTTAGGPVAPARYVTIASSGSAIWLF